MSVTIGNTTYLPGQSIPLPVGTTPLVYTIKDSTGAVASSPTSVTVVGPPSITAPADQTLNATSAAGVSSYTIPQPASSTCPQPTCQISVLYNGTLYKPGDTIPLPVGTTTLTYSIVDSKGNTATDSLLVDVVGPPSIDAPAPVTLNATGPSGAPVTLQPQADQYCGAPNCTIKVGEPFLCAAVVFAIATLVNAFAEIYTSYPSHAHCLSCSTCRAACLTL